jgi:ABC-2 type transport system ATP-binding protein
VIAELVDSGSTVLLTTQYLEEADRLADRVAVIDQGRVIADGTPERLKARLGSTVIEIGLPDEDAAARAAGLVGAVGMKPPVREGSELAVTVDDGPHALVDVMRALDVARLSPTTLAVREPSLDDVFLALTGQRATEPTGDHELRGAA